MRQKYVFKNGSTSLLYDITKKKKTLFNVLIPQDVYREAFQELSDDILKNHFSIKKCIDYEEQGNMVILTFDISIDRQFVMQGLSHLFDWLNNGKLLHHADATKKQIMTCNVQSTSLAVSFAPWVHSYFKNEEHAAHFFLYAKQQMQETQRVFLSKKKSDDYTQCDFDGDGFYFKLFGNGLWLTGNYRDNEFDTHNCDTYIDQAIFFAGCVALCDSLRYYLKTGKYLP